MTCNYQYFLPIAIKESPFDKRICRQSGNFTLHGIQVKPLEKLNPPDDVLIKIIVTNCLTQEFKKLLCAFGINKESIYYGIDVKDSISKELIDDINNNTIPKIIAELKKKWTATPETERGIPYHMM